MKIEEYIQYDAVGLSRLIKDKEVSAKEVVEAAIARLKEVNPDLNAVIHERTEKVLKELDEQESYNLPFFGVPIVLKDLSQNMEGEPTTSGSRLLTKQIANCDDNFVKKIREAGFSVLGRTNTPEFGLKNITEPEIYGPSRNPWNTDYSPGGSSGGSAAAVASGIVPVAGASDGGGSIRIPASFTGLVGLKTTRGRTPVGPGFGRAWQGAAVHFVLTRTVRDSAALLDLMQVLQPEAAFQTPLFEKGYLNVLHEHLKKPLRIAYTTKSPVGTPVSDDARVAVEKVVRWLEQEGHIVEEKAAPVDGVALMEAYYLMNSGEMNLTVLQLEKALGRKLTADDMEIETWLLHFAGQAVTAAEYSNSLPYWDWAAEQMAYFHNEYDFYITPTTAYSAPKVGELTHSREKQMQLREAIAEANKEEQQQIIYDMFLPSLTYTPFTQLANLTGQPGISVPVHVTADGLPLGGLSQVIVGIFFCHFF